MVRIRDHAVLRYAERCYGQVYAKVADMPSNLRERYRSELRRNVAGAVILTDEQTHEIKERSGTLDAGAGNNGTFCYADDVLTVVSIESDSWLVYTVLPLRPMALRYLEEIGLRPITIPEGFRPEVADLEVLVLNELGILPDEKLIGEWISRAPQQPRCKVYIETKRLGWVRHVLRCSGRTGVDVKAFPVPTKSETEGAERGLREWVEGALLKAQNFRVFIICDAEFLGRLIPLLCADTVQKRLLSAPTASGYVHTFNLKDERAVDYFVSRAFEPAPPES